LSSDESDEQLPTAIANMLNTKYFNFISISIFNHELHGFHELSMLVPL
jgi:hypothetical protein